MFSAPQVPLGGRSCEILVGGKAALLVSSPEGLHTPLPLALQRPRLFSLHPGTLCQGQGQHGTNPDTSDGEESSRTEMRVKAQACGLLSESILPI
jgi:hypothetical protein